MRLSPIGFFTRMAAAGVALLSRRIWIRQVKRFTRSFLASNDFMPSPTAILLLADSFSSVS